MHVPTIGWLTGRFRFLEDTVSHSYIRHLLFTNASNGRPITAKAVTHVDELNLSISFDDAPRSHRITWNWFPNISKCNKVCCADPFKSFEKARKFVDGCIANGVCELKLDASGVIPSCYAPLLLSFLFEEGSSQRAERTLTVPRLVSFGRFLPRLIEVIS